MESQSEKTTFFDAVPDPPAWLSQNYLESILKQQENDPDLQITSCIFELCTKPGDNFVGVIFRTPITYTTRDRVVSESFIIKIEPFLDGVKKEMMTNATYFDVEGRFYTEVATEIENLMREISDGDEQMAPKCIYSGSNPNIIIMKDISRDGFQMIRSSLNRSNAEVVIRKIAKFHAISLVLKERGTAPVDQFNEGLVFAPRIHHWNFSLVYLNSLCELLTEWNRPELSKKIEGFKPCYLNRLAESFQAQKNGLNVLNHGDFHVRNMMLKTDNEKNIEDMRLIDFQGCIWASPAIDLAMVLNANLDYNCIENDREELLSVYIDQLKQVLTDLKYNAQIPTNDDINEELQKHMVAEFFFLTSFNVFFFMNIDDLEGHDMFDAEIMPRFARKTYQHPELKKILLSALDKLDNRGFFNLPDTN